MNQEELEALKKEMRQNGFMIKQLWARHKALNERGKEIEKQIKIIENKNKILAELPAKLEQNKGENMINNTQLERWWDNLSAEGKLQAIKILIQYPEQTQGEAKDYILKQIKEFDKFYTLPITDKEDIQSMTKERRHLIDD